MLVLLNFEKSANRLYWEIAEILCTRKPYKYLPYKYITRFPKKKVTGVTIMNEKLIYVLTFAPGKKRRFNATNKKCL